MSVPEVTRLKELEQENTELKKIVAELTIDNRMLRDVNEKRMVSVPERRRAVTYLRTEYSVSERRACEVIPISQSTYRHSGTQPVVDAAHTEVVQLSHHYPYWGYRKIFAFYGSKTDLPSVENEFA